MTLHAKTLTLLFFSGLLFFTNLGCSKKDNTPAVNTPSLPVLTTSAVTSIGYTTAQSGGTVTSDGGAPVTARGTCWDLSGTPTISNSHTSDGTGTGAYTSQLTFLTPNTLYYARAYATNSQGTAYGSAEPFTTHAVVADSLADIDGNFYHIVPIGAQSWLRENLRVTRYRNGEAIPQVTVDNLWKILTTGAYCTYDNVSANGSLFGNLYNWHTLTDSRGLCPAGWHIPSNIEWAGLSVFLGGDLVSGGRMKSSGTIEGATGLWYAPNTEATNSSGFTGLPGGYRINYGTYYSAGNVGYFWSASDTAADNGWNYILDANNGQLKRNFNLKTNGFSVRCCKD